MAGTRCSVETRESLRQPGRPPRKATTIRGEGMKTRALLYIGARAAVGAPIKAIAGKVGFASRSYFTRAFKSYANAHPSEYRAAHRSTSS